MLNEYWVNHPELRQALFSLIAFSSTLAIGYLIKRWVFHRLEAWAKTTEVTWDDDLLTAISNPCNALIGLFAFTVGLQWAPQHVRDFSIARLGPKIVFVLLCIWLFDNALNIFIRHMKVPGHQSKQAANTTRTLTLMITRLALLSVTLLIMLDTLGVSITPLLASLGVGSVAVALALQDTLSNFFSGIYLLVDRPIRLGDYIALDKDTKGFVRKIGLRSTRVELGSNATMVLPNSKLSSSQITNYDLHGRNTVITVDASVSYESDLQKVETVTLEVATQIQQTSSAGSADFKPAMRFQSFADSAISLFVVLQAKHVTESSILTHDFIKALHQRFRQEGIDIPFPQRVLHVKSDSLTVRSNS